MAQTSGTINQQKTRPHHSAKRSAILTTALILASAKRFSSLAAGLVYLAAQTLLRIMTAANHIPAPRVKRKCAGAAQHRQIGLTT
jgi:hypothetical protein